MTDIQGYCHGCDRDTYQCICHLAGLGEDEPPPAYITLAAPDALVEAAKAQCCMCGKTGLSTVEGDGGTECQLTDGRWTCSSDCWERAVEPDARVEAAVRAGIEVAVQWAAAVPENHVAFLIANHITAFNSDLHIVAGDIRVIAADPAEVKRIVEGLATPKGDSQ